MMRIRYVWLTALAIGLPGIISVTPAAQTPTYSFSTLASFPTTGLYYSGGMAGAAYFKGTLLVAHGMFLVNFTPTGVDEFTFPAPVDATSAVAFDDAGMAYVASGCGVAKAPRGGAFTQVAGSRFSHHPADACGSADGNATTAKFNRPGGIAVNGAGTAIYVADTGNSTIRLVTSAGDTSTIAGAAGQSGAADGLGTNSRFSAPSQLALDAAGNLFIADTGNHTIRRMAPDGMVTTVAGLAGSEGATDGAGTSARFKSPVGLAFGPDGNLYVADAGNSLVRRVTPAGVVTTIATPALNRARGIALDDVGTLYIADTGNNVILQGVLGTAAAPSIVTQPASVTVTGGATVTLTVAMSGNPTPGVRWQISTNGGASWSDVAEAAPYSGTRTPALTIRSVTGPFNGRRYRAIAANPSGTVTSAAAVLSVDAITVSPTLMQFAASKAGASGGITAVTSPQEVSVVFSISNSTWTATADQPWLQLTGATGSGRGLFTVAIVNPNNVIGGSSLLTATVTVSSASGLVTALPVSLSVDQTNTTRAPSGLLETPQNGATGLQGSIAVTGWAIDDIGVDRVEIWRDPVAGETTDIFTGPGSANGKIFVGTAAFVSGARPDVARTYFTYPNADRAGWGYLMLTYGLPNQGNGTYRLYAIAIDVNGTTSSIIGTTTIGVDNAHATRPFGSIDTPGQGGTVSGTIHNFGWALTPGGSCSIANPNVQVSFDSGPLLPVVYGDVRPDVAAAFPGYTNAPAAGAHYTLDTTQLTDGVHTIGWLVTDSCGRSEGVGSRFFTVVNGGSALRTAQAMAATTSVEPAWSVARGTAPARPPARDVSGARVLRMDQNDRVEVQLPGWEPYVAGPLPLGSSFDAATGRFYWQPAAGFLGAYELEFTAGARTERLRVVVGPPIRMVVDTPRAGNVLDSSGFTLGGWAVDLAALDGAGIDTLHVWAYPVTSLSGPGSSKARPVFVGVARVGGSRPDVARLYGAGFTSAGFTLSGSLPPGTYDLVVYAHSAATNRYDGAEVVRVVVR